ncbi:diguanylate cyclase, partial [Clostridium perfringens]|uniref:GGDEF domain-containing protein n=1 Tax=Clostridium perfringens TaxID=1502 RepID=UPI002AC7CD57
ISMRAYNEADTFVKIEYNKEKIYMIMASPIVMENKKYVFEMLKDVTNTGIIENFSEKTSEEIQLYINGMNDKIIKDELTGIYNRRFIDERLPIDILKSASQKSPLSIIIADIDFFKSINSNYGHLAGDYILFE